MALHLYKFVNQTISKCLFKSYATKYHYEMPERYRNAFCLANAALFDSVNWYVHRAYEVGFSNLVDEIVAKDSLQNPDAAIAKLRKVMLLFEQCNSMTDVRFPIKRDNGNYEIIRGFRAQHGLSFGGRPSLGGLRIKETLTRDHVKALSVLSTYRHACMGIKLPGSHGGIKLNPADYSQNELKTIIKTYIREFHRRGYCNGFDDIVEPDINTGEIEMYWISTVDSATEREKWSEAVVGKPMLSGGIEDYDKTASQGVYFALDHFLNDDDVIKHVGLEKGLKNKRYIIQGLGKLGTPLCKYLNKSGAICIGIKECDAYIHDPKGIDVVAVINHKKENGTIQTYLSAKALTDNEILTKECDILILAASQKSLICYSAAKVQAKVIVEAANGSITPTSYRILHSQSKLVIPDIYVCSGYSVASYIEYLRNLKKLKCKETSFVEGIYRNIFDNLSISGSTRQVVDSAVAQKIAECDMEHHIVTYAIQHIMTVAANELLKIQKDYKLRMDFKSAAYIKAIRHITELQTQELNKELQKITAT